MNNKKIQDLKEEILKLKEKENALILAHFYLDIDIQEIADEYGIDYIQISSKTGENFDRLIERLKEIVCES